MEQINFNDYVVIYPTAPGWDNMRDLVKDNYLLSDDDADLFISSRKTKDGGYKEQLWVIFRDFGHMFYSGREYLYFSSMSMSVEKVVL